jgi:hypothetical protein
MNEKLPRKSSLDLMLTQHLCDEDPEPREVGPCREIEPPQVWYYRIFSNSHTFVILLQIDPVSGDEPEIIFESFYKTKNTFIFTWPSIPGVAHFHWLRNPIRQLLLNNKAYYLVHTIRRILDFL